MAPLARVLPLLALLWVTACVASVGPRGSLRVFDHAGQLHHEAARGELATSSPALPPDAAPYEVRAVAPSKYLVKTWGQGSFLLSRGTLVPLRGLPRSRVWRGDDKVVYREVHDMKELVVPDGYPTSQVRPILALNDNDVLMSLDGGTTFRKWPLVTGDERGPSGLPKHSVLLSTAFWQQSAAVLDHAGKQQTPGLCAAVGTSSRGVFVSCDGGFTWTPKSDGLPGLPAGDGIFYEAVRALHVDLATQTLYAGTELGRGAYRSPLSPEAAFVPIALGRFVDDVSRDQCSINAISTSPGKLYLSGDCQPLIVASDSSVQAAPLLRDGAYVSFYRYFADDTRQPDSVAAQVAFHADGKGAFYTYDNPSAIPRRAPRAFPHEPGECRGFYISAASSMTGLDVIRRLLDSGKFNCVVVDMKDDFGRVPVEVTTPLIERYATQRSDWSVAELGKLLAHYQVWKIARHVTMKDHHLVDATEGRLALLDRATGKAWVGEDQDKWSDPYNREVWEYNAEIASTYQALGFDEVQFDYIRLPSQADRTLSPTRDGDTYASEVVASFLSLARTKTHLPVSIDIFGFSGLYRTDWPLGQNMQSLGEYVDVVSPMVYPSHFDDRYFTRGSLEQRAYNLLLHATGRANALARGRVVIRCWLQAFDEKSDVWGYGRTFFDAQTQGSIDGGSKGWLWWGSLGELLGLVQPRLMDARSRRGDGARRTERPARNERLLTWDSGSTSLYERVRQQIAEQK